MEFKSQPVTAVFLYAGRRNKHQQQIANQLHIHQRKHY